MDEPLDRHGRVLLARWQGSDAQVYGYRLSHSHLVLRLFQNDRRGCLRIVVSPCHFWTGPTEWQKTVIQLVSNPNGEIILYDRENGVVAIGGGVSVFEHLSGPDTLGGP